MRLINLLTSGNVIKRLESKIMGWIDTLISCIAILFIGVMSGIMNLILFRLILFKNDKPKKVIKNKISKRTKKIIKYFKKIEKIIYSSDKSIRPDSWDLGAIYKDLCSMNLL